MPLNRVGCDELLTRTSPGLENLYALDLNDNVELAALPRVLFAELCSLTSLEVRGVASAAFDDDSFAGFARCENVMYNDEAKEMCESQQDIFVKGSCQ